MRKFIVRINPIDAKEGKTNLQIGVKFYEFNLNDREEAYARALSTFQLESGLYLNLYQVINPGNRRDEKTDFEEKAVMTFDGKYVLSIAIFE